MNGQEKYAQMNQSIIDLAAALVRIQSRSGIDPSENILNFLSRWLSQHGLTSNLLRGQSGKHIGLYVHLKSQAPGPAICLNACVDSAPFGTEEMWSFPPTSGTIKEGRLFGRGAADSKMGVSIFSHIGMSIHETNGLSQGELYLLFDADEHTGEFQGIKSFLEAVPRPPDAVLIGYPGNDRLFFGSRGFLRLEITVIGQAAHSGSSSRRGLNAITKMAQLIDALNTQPLPEEPDPDFSFGPRINITEVRGGDGFSLVPDRCTCKVDFRLTPRVDQQVAKKWLESVVRSIDLTYPGPIPTGINWLGSWPAYRLPLDSPLVMQFLDVAQEVFSRKIVPSVSGPSNIGNYLSSKGIPALSGFGVTYSNIHGTDESVELDSIMPVYETYRRAILRLLSSLPPQAIG